MPHPADIDDDAVVLYTVESTEWYPCRFRVVRVAYYVGHFKYQPRVGAKSMTASERNAIAKESGTVPSAPRLLNQ